MEKPANIKAVELKNNIAKLLNDSKLPAFVTRPIIEDIYNQTINLEQMQLENSQREYEEALKREENLKKKGGKENGIK